MEFTFDDIIYDIQGRISAHEAEREMLDLGFALLREQIEYALDELADIYPPEVELPSVDEVVDEVHVEWFKEMNL